MNGDLMAPSVTFTWWRLTVQGWESWTALIFQGGIQPRKKVTLDKALYLRNFLSQAVLLHSILNHRNFRTKHKLLLVLRNQQSVLNVTYNLWLWMTIMSLSPLPRSFQISIVPVESRSKIPSSCPTAFSHIHKCSICLYFLTTESI